MSRRSTVIAVVLFIVIADVMFGGWIWFQNKVSGPGPHQTDQVVLVPPGSGIQSIAQTLVDQGVIESDWVFRLAARIKQADRSLKSGEFTIPAKASIYEVLTVLTKGETVSRSFTVPEGLTVVEALAIVRPVWSSMTCAEMCREERNTARRGRAAVPRTALRIRWWRR